MSVNQIIKKIIVGTIIKNEQEITLSITTQTSGWLRPEFIARQQGPAFKTTVEGSRELVPAGTKDICQSEHRHSSDSDSRERVCFDAEGKGQSVHFPAEEETSCK